MRYAHCVSYRHLPLLCSFVKYTLVGGGGAVADFCTLMLCYQVLGWHYLLASACGFTAGLLLVYIFSNLWVFDERKLKSSPGKEFVIFSLIGIAGLLLTQGFMWLFVDGCGFLVPIAKCITMALVLLWNFGARKWILY